VHGVTLPLLDPSQADGPVRIFVRPEDLTLESAGAASARSVPGTVLLSSFLGSLRRTSVLLEQGGTVVVQHDVRQRPEVGEKVSVRFGGAPVPVEDESGATAAGAPVPVAAPS
jgi:putative spermidine/putrescine transport system ATP-binding protein